MSVKRQHEEFDTAKHWAETEKGSRDLVPLKSMLKTFDSVDRYPIRSQYSWLTKNARRRLLASNLGSVIPF